MESRIFKLEDHISIPIDTALYDDASAVLTKYIEKQIMEFCLQYPFEGKEVTKIVSKKYTDANSPDNIEFVVYALYDMQDRKRYPNIYAQPFRIKIKFNFIHLSFTYDQKYSNILPLTELYGHVLTMTRRLTDVGIEDYNTIINCQIMLNKIKEKYSEFVSKYIDLKNSFRN